MCFCRKRTQSFSHPTPPSVSLRRAGSLGSGPTSGIRRSAPIAIAGGRAGRSRMNDVGVAMPSKSDWDIVNQNEYAVSTGSVE